MVTAVASVMPAFLSLNVPALAMPTRGPTLAKVSRRPEMSTGTEFSGRDCWDEVTELEVWEHRLLNVGTVDG